MDDESILKSSMADCPLAAGLMGAFVGDRELEPALLVKEEEKPKQVPVSDDKLKKEIMQIASQAPQVKVDVPNAEEIKDLEDMLDDLI